MFGFATYRKQKAANEGATGSSSGGGDVGNKAPTQGALSSSSVTPPAVSSPMLTMSASAAPPPSMAPLPSAASGTHVGEAVQSSSTTTIKHGKYCCTQCIIYYPCIQCNNCN
mmetsp:Transcript_14982/g.42330  ORF Transcript_14982/g.42330 Transcript_14982/m.42330 type:complete len:112 (+) Transcript_14982:249-584(+)